MNINYIVYGCMAVLFEVTKRNSHDRMALDSFRVKIYQRINIGFVVDTLDTETKEF